MMMMTIKMFIFRHVFIQLTIMGLLLLLFQCTYDFCYLQTPMEQVRALKERGENYTPMLALNVCIHSRHKGKILN